MPPPLIVLVLVAVGDARDPSVLALTATTEEALGPGTIVVVREVVTRPDDAAALSVGSAVHADALVEISWPDPQRLRASLHVHPSKDSPTWTDRDLAFAPADAAAERGRTLGFAVASMIPAATTASTATAATTATTATAATAPATGPPTAVAATAAPRPADTTAKSPALQLEPRDRLIALELDGVATAGVGGAASGWGGALTGLIPIASSVVLRLGGGARFGSIAAAGAATSVARAHLGLGWQPLRDAASGLGLGVRGHLVVLRDAVSRTDPTEAGARWLPGVDLELEVAWSVASSVELLVAGGAELAFGTTHVVVGTEAVASIPPVRLLAELGVRTRF